MRMVWQTKHFGKERFHSHNLLIVAAVLILCVAAEKCADRFARGKPTTPDGKTIIRGIHLWNIGIRSRYKNWGCLKIAKSPKRTMSLRTSAHAGVAIPPIFKHLR